MGETVGGELFFLFFWMTDANAIFRERKEGKYFWLFVRCQRSKWIFGGGQITVLRLPENIYQKNATQKTYSNFRARDSKEKKRGSSFPPSTYPVKEERGGIRNPAKKRRKNDLKSVSLDQRNKKGVRFPCVRWGLSSQPHLPAFLPRSQPVVFYFVFFTSIEKPKVLPFSPKIRAQKYLKLLFERFSMWSKHRV